MLFPSTAYTHLWRSFAVACCNNASNVSSAGSLDCTVQKTEQPFKEALKLPALPVPRAQAEDGTSPNLACQNCSLLVASFCKVPTLRGWLSHLLSRTRFQASALEITSPETSSKIRSSFCCLSRKFLGSGLIFSSKAPSQKARRTACMWQHSPASAKPWICARQGACCTLLVQYPCPSPRISPWIARLYRMARFSEK